MSAPRISVCVPTHDMLNGEYFLQRLKDSLDEQTFKDFELIITTKGKMAENTNSAIRQAKGEIIKILFMDDFLRPDALQNLSDNFTGGWYASGCEHTMDDTEFFNPHVPTYELPRSLDTNTIGSPSVVAFENKDPELFDENLSWMLDVELYGRLYKRYGAPTLVPTMDVVIGIHAGQMTHILTAEEKHAEEYYLNEKIYGTY